MGDEVQKPTQTDEDVNWSPKNPADWKKIDLYGNNGVPRNRPNIMEWDPLEPKTNGMTITHQDSTNLFRVMCGGVTYETNWDNMWPPLPSAGKIPTGKCEVYKEEKTVITEVTNVTYTCYVRQTQCLLQINCVLTYSITEKTVRCTGDPQLWKVTQTKKSDISKTRANYFTCPCK